MAGCEQALAKVADDNLFRVAHGGQVDAGVPAEKYIDVRRYTMQLSGRQDSRFLSGLRRFRMTRLRDFGMTELRRF
jgi:hypothetical protein